jgi:hypothetical protein
MTEIDPKEFYKAIDGLANLMDAAIPNDTPTLLVVAALGNFISKALIQLPHDDAIEVGVNLIDLINNTIRTMKNAGH